MLKRRRYVSHSCEVREHMLNMKQNIEKAKKEVERLEAEESSTPATPVTPVHANGDSKATASVDEGGSVKNEIELSKEADEDLAKDLKAASIEDKE
jgi:hypothetical protein